MKEDQGKKVFDMLEDVLASGLPWAEDLDVGRGRLRSVMDDWCLRSDHRTWQAVDGTSKSRYVSMVISVVACTME